MKSIQVVLASRPVGMPSAANLRYEEKSLEGVREGEVLLKSLFISVDPYMRGRMNDTKSYSKPYEIDEPLRGGVVARVMESGSKLFSEGDIVTGELPWMTFCIESEGHIRKIDTSLAPASYYLGILGMPGLTAYVGMIDIGKPQKGETTVVSGAAGAVGLVAGQIARIEGSRVIGIAGSDEKCGILKSKFGFSDAINYKTSKNIKKSIRAICPDGVDVYYDNVGGSISQGVIDNLNFHSRVILCGQISQYNNTRPEMIPDPFPRILTRSIMVRGFIVRNFSHRYNEGISYLAEHLRNGDFQYSETIIKGFDKLPEAFLGLFSGVNLGKLLVEADDKK